MSGHGQTCQVMDRHVRSWTDMSGHGQTCQVTDRHVRSWTDMLGNGQETWCAFLASVKKRKGCHDTDLYVCMHVCVYVCTLCMYVYVCECVHVYVYVCMGICVCVYMHSQMSKTHLESWQHVNSSETTKCTYTPREVLLGWLWSWRHPYVLDALQIRQLWRKTPVRPCLDHLNMYRTRTCVM
jgi:hypothetical protein